MPSRKLNGEAAGRRRQQERRFRQERTVPALPLAFLGDCPAHGARLFVTTGAPASTAGTARLCGKRHPRERKGVQRDAQQKQDPRREPTQRQASPSHCLKLTARSVPLNIRV